MCQSIREAVYLIAELSAIGHSRAELLEVAQQLQTPNYSAEYLLTLAEKVCIQVFDCAA